MPVRWRAAPSSAGAGIFDQSGASIWLFMIVRWFEELKDASLR